MMTPLEPTKSTGAAAASVQNALAAPSQAEFREMRIEAAIRSYELLCMAANTSDRLIARTSLLDAEILLGIDDAADMEQEASALSQLLSFAARPASRVQVARAVASLVGSFPNFSKAEARGYGTALAEDIASAQPSQTALLMSMRRLRRTSRFMPSIAEALEALRTAEREVKRAWLAVDLLEERWQAARAQLEHLDRLYLAWLDREVAEYRSTVAAGKDVRHFTQEVVAAALQEERDRPF